jgi:hypothetical protein
MRRTFLIAGVCTMMAVHGLEAQSAQRLSIQGSGLFINLMGDAFSNAESGYGFEAQVRYTPSALSLGAGFQYTRHKLENTDLHANLVGGFFEPRYVFSTSSASLFPYLSGRFYVVRLSSTNEAQQIKTTSTGVAANGGGGVLIRVGSRVNIDLGATYGYCRFGEFKFEDLSSGLTSTSDGNNGTNLVGRVGLTFGL